MLRPPDRANTLRVTGQTSLEELRQFSGQAGDKAKIRGKVNDDGSVTLYASTKKGTGLNNLVKDDRVAHRQAARTAVDTVLTRVQGQKNLDVLMTPVHQQLAGKGELRGAALADIVARASAARTSAIQNPRDIGQIGASLRDALNDGNAEARGHVAAELGSLVAASVRGKSRDEQMEFAISHGDALKKQLLTAMAMNVPEPGPLATSYKDASPELRAALDEAYQQAATRLADHQNGDGTLEIGGKTYTKDRHLAAGSFGSVDVYKAADGEEIAVKTPKLDDPTDKAELAAKFDEAAAEVRAHRSAVAGDPANVVGLKGVVRTADGGLQIALELAARGDAGVAIGKLNTAAQNRQITPQEANLARLTIVRDMIEGLRHVQETRGMTHLDIKGPNYFVDAGGVVKLGDFGTARAGARQQLESNPIGNPRWAAPELVKGGNVRRAQVNAMMDQLNADRTAAVSKLKDTLSGGDLETAISNYRAGRNDHINHELGKLPKIDISSKVDTWSIGVEVYKAFTNKLPFDSDRGLSSQIEDALTAFADRGAKLRMPPGNDLFGLDRTQFRQLDTLVGQLMHPDPQQRPTLTQALQNPLFQLPGVGSPQARATILQVTT